MAWALREWCRLAGTRTTYIEPGAPWENPFVESFNGRVRDELLDVEEVATLLEAQVVVEAWRIDRVQHLADTLQPRWAYPRREPQEVDHRTAADALITAGPSNGGPVTVDRQVHV